MNVAILLLASGRGLRLANQTPKVYLPVGGVPMLIRSLRRLARLAAGAEIVLAARPEDRATHLQSLLPELEGGGLSKVVDGGASRQESMIRAFDTCSPDRDLIVIHDAARPFFPIEAGRRALARAAAVGAALLAIPAPDTLKRVDGEHRVIDTLDRDGIWLAQTPQVVQRPALERAIAAARAGGHPATDDVSLLQRIGVPVEVVSGSPRNIKITTPADLAFAELLARFEDDDT